MASSTVGQTCFDGGTETIQLHADEAGLAQLVRAPGCGSGGRGFNPHSSPQIKRLTATWGFLILRSLIFYLNR